MRGQVEVVGRTMHRRVEKRVLKLIWKRGSDAAIHRLSAPATVSIAESSASLRYVRGFLRLRLGTVFPHTMNVLLLQAYLDSRLFARFSISRTVPFFKHHVPRCLLLQDLGFEKHPCSFHYLDGLTCCHYRYQRCQPRFASFAKRW
jgi:hypothetical protein